MINFNADVSSVVNKPDIMPKTDNKTVGKPDFGGAVDAAKGYVSSVDDLQQSANMSITDLLTGKNEDLNTVVAAMAKADISFKLLVGVRNKLVEAYKRTMNMQI